MMSKYPPLPVEPACWSWELPPLPMQSWLPFVRKWQAGRCAVCAFIPDQSRNLFEDHDHLTGNTRGFLCPRCNMAEGSRVHRGAEVFAKYRERHPTSMLGVLNKWGRDGHPAIDIVVSNWERALRDLADLEDEDAQAEWHRMNWRLIERGTPPALPEWTPLMLAAKRVGMTNKQWLATLAHRHEVESAVPVCIPDGTLRLRTACDPRSGWRPPPAYGRRLKPCPECYRIDREAMLDLLGPESYGKPWKSSDSPNCERCYQSATMLATWPDETGEAILCCGGCVGPMLSIHALSGRSVLIRPLPTKSTESALAGG